MTSRPDPYAEFIALAKTLEAEGVDPDLIADAMLTVGLNGAHRMHGPAFVQDYLADMIGVFQKAKEQRTPPPTAH
jgi:hypothetical protein